MRNLSCENELYLHENEKRFPYQRLSTYPRFETEARGNSEMAYYSAFSVSKQVVWHWIDIVLSLKNVAVWSNHTMMIFIENHFETYFCQVFIF